MLHLGQPLEATLNCQVIPQSTCSSFAVLFISSLHLIPCLQLGKSPALLKNHQGVLVMDTPRALHVSCLDRCLASQTEMSCVWNSRVSMELVQIPVALLKPV